MKFKKSDIYSLAAPFMVALSMFGFLLVEENKKFFYLPLGFMGIFIISEKELSRRLRRKNIFNKIKSYQKNK